MKLLTKEILRQVPKLYAQDGKGLDAIAYAKFFNPTGSQTWFMTELDPDTKEAFGLFRDSQESELGYFSILELERTVVGMGLHIERDIHFKPTSLREIKKTS